MSRERAVRPLLAWIVACGVAAGTAVAAADLPPRLFDVSVESARRTTSGGDTVAYDLYVPKAASGMPGPPWPALVLDHGFARSKEAHARTARALAERGIAVLAPNLVSLLGGEKAQLAAVADTRDHVAWLKRRAATSGDRLFGLLDPQRFALAGHSAGGAVAFEAAVGSTDVRAVVLLDAVPWARTVQLAPRLAGVKLASLRSEPSPCNARGNVQDLLARITVRAEDVRIVGGTHCDPENPTDFWCRLGCGGTGAGARELYGRLLFLFLQDALEVEPVEEPPDSWEEAIARGARSGSVVVKPVGPEPRGTRPPDVAVR